MEYIVKVFILELDKKGQVFLLLVDDAHKRLGFTDLGKCDDVKWGIINSTRTT